MNSALGYIKNRPYSFALGDVVIVPKMSQQIGTLLSLTSLVELRSDSLCIIAHKGQRISPA